MRGGLGVGQKRTKICVGVTPALSTGVCITLGAVLEGLVLVANVIEEVDLVLLGEERSADAVHWGISPPLVVEATLLVQEVEELHVPFAAPEVEVTYLEIAPDYVCGC